MKEYTSKEIKVLKANPYTFKVTKSKLYFTAEFKEAFWIDYQAGITPRKLLLDMGYDTEMSGQKQIDSIVQRIKKQAQNGYGFTQGENRNRREKSVDLLLSDYIIRTSKNNGIASGKIITHTFENLKKSD